MQELGWYKARKCRQDVLTLGVQVLVAQRHRSARTEERDGLLLPLAEGARILQKERRNGTRADIEAENTVLADEAPFAGDRRALYPCYDGGIQHFGHRRAYRMRVAPRRCDHPRLRSHGSKQGLPREKEQGVLAGNKQGGDLLEDPVQQWLYRRGRKQRAGRCDHLLEAAALHAHGAEVSIGAHGAGDRGAQPLRGELGFGVVIVDVVVLHHPLFGGEPRLPGAEHHADQRVLQLGADPLRDAQTGVVLLHDHVQQHQRAVRLVLQQHAGFSPGARVREADRRAAHSQVPERHPGDDVEALVIVHDGHAPAGLGAFDRERFRFGGLIGEQQLVVGEIAGGNRLHLRSERPRAGLGMGRLRRQWLPDWGAVVSVIVPSPSIRPAM